MTDVELGEKVPPFEPRESYARSEAEVAADVVIRLFETGLLEWAPEVAKKVSVKTALPLPLLRSQWLRRSQNVFYRPPRGTNCAPTCIVCGVGVGHGESYCSRRCRTEDSWRAGSPEPPASKRSAGQRASERYLAANPEPGALRRCAQCEQTKPVEEFGWKDRKKGFRRSYCRDCWRERQREHYLSREQRLAMSRVRLAFTADKESGIVGLACLDCGLLIEEGELVYGEAHIRHETCPEADGKPELPVVT